MHRCGMLTLGLNAFTTGGGVFFTKSNSTSRQYKLGNMITCSARYDYNVITVISIRRSLIFNHVYDYDSWVMQQIILATSFIWVEKRHHTANLHFKLYR